MSNGKVYIETTRLVIRQWEERDLIPFFKLNSCPDVMKFFPKLLSMDQARHFIHKTSNFIKENGYSFWAVELKEKSEFVGTIGVNEVLFEAPFTPAIEIGWRLSKNYWRQGLATEGAKAALDYSFSTLKFDEVVSFTSSINIPSMKLMEKIGMKRDLQGDFEHPNIEFGHPLRKHVLYRLNKKKKTL